MAMKPNNSSRLFLLQSTKKEQVNEVPTQTENRRSNSSDIIKLIVFISLLSSSFFTVLRQVKKIKIRFDSFDSVQKAIAEHNNSTPTLPTKMTEESSSHPIPVIIDSNKFPIPISIVVQLSGEMGNNMDKIAFGRSVQLMAQEMYPDMPTNLVLRHQDGGGPKWRRAESSLKKCFPQFAYKNFSLGNTDEFTTRVEQQAQALGDDKSNLDLMGRPDDDKIRATFDYLYNEAIPAIQNHDESTSRANGNISLPFIMTNSFAVFDHIDRYYDEIQQYLRFDEAACCKHIPYPDESVFHLRNFQGEMQSNAHRKGYMEITPNQTANELFSHLQEGSKVAILSRGYDKNVQAYEDQLNARGLQARIIHSNSGVNDFCFLLKTEKEMAGYSRSSYFRWAAFLALNVSKAHIYTTKTRMVVNSKPDQAHDSPLVVTSEGINSFVKCDWNNTILKHRIQCRFFDLAN